MELKFGPHMAFGVSDMHEAATFYQDVMGFKVSKRTDDWIELEAGTMKIYVVQDNIRQPTFEVIAKDVDSAAEYLEHHGCLVDERMSQDAGEPIVRDPYGYLWLVSKQKS